MERADPVSVDAFGIELFVHEYEINGKGYELTLAVLSDWALLRAEFVNSNGRETTFIITIITNTGRVLDAFFDLDIPCILLLFYLYNIFLSFIADNYYTNYN
jgi:hypothetical protein